MFSNNGKAKLIERNLEELKKSLGYDNLDDVFEFFAAEQLLKDYDLDSDEVKSGITGASGDNGIDAFYIFVDGELIVDEESILNINERKKIDKIELHFHQYKNNFSIGEDVLLKFNYAFQTIFNIENQDFRGWNEILENKVRLFHKLEEVTFSKKPTFFINVFHISKGNFSNIEDNDSYWSKADNMINTICNGYLDIKKENITFNYIGAEQLLDLYRKEKNYALELKLSETPITIEFNDSNHRGYIASVNLIDYYNLITENGVLKKHLFDANIRDYQKNTFVNKKILNSLNNPENSVDFWWLNNGITIISSEDRLGGKKLTLTNVQIVNGLQTSYSIFESFSKKSDLEDNRSLLVKIIIANDKEQIDNIIQSTNSQNPVPPSLLRSTDNIQRDIEDYFEKNGFYYDRRKNFYKNQRKDIKKIITINFLSQCVVSILVQEKNPSKARSTPTTLTKNDEDYNNLFNKEINLDAYLNSVILVKKVMERLKVYNNNDEVKSLISKYYYFHVSRVLASMIMKKAYFHANEFARLDKEVINTVSDEMIDKALLLLEDMIKAYLGNKMQNSDLNNLSKNQEFSKHITHYLLENI